MSNHNYRAASAVGLSLFLGAMVAVGSVAFAETEEQAVIAVEDAWVGAEVAHDEATLRRVIDDRFLFNGNNGQVSGKDPMIESVLGSGMTGQTITERTVLVDGNTAVIFGTAEFHYASSDAEDTPSRARYTTVYVKRDGDWRAIALQMAGRSSE